MVFEVKIEELKKSSACFDCKKRIQKGKLVVAFKATRFSLSSGMINYCLGCGEHAVIFYLQKLKEEGSEKEKEWGMKVLPVIYKQITKTRIKEGEALSKKGAFWARS